MKSSIMIGRRGSITLPAKLRKKYGMQENDTLLVEETPQGILLRPSVSMPIEIYSDERIAEFMEQETAANKLFENA